MRLGAKFEHLRKNIEHLVTSKKNYPKTGVNSFYSFSNLKYLSKFPNTCILVQIVESYDHLKVFSEQFLTKKKVNFKKLYFENKK
jgi:hypothetical protein